MDDTRLSIRNLGKAYNVPVLRDINLDLARGEVLGLVGENGAGKSTLINILAGLVEADAGQIHIDGVTYVPASASDAFAAGVSFAAQELSVIETLSVAENISLRQFPARAGVIHRETLATDARRLLDRVGLGHVDADEPLAHLSLGERQLVEIARAVSADCRLLMLDEPTAALTAQQADTVHALIRELAASGTSIIYVSHRLDDVLQFTDRVSVLRDGALVSTKPASDVSPVQLVELMSGAQEEPGRDASRARLDGSLVLTASSLRTDDLPYGIDIELRAGEIAGLAGLAGAGKSELLSALFGLVPASGAPVQSVFGNKRSSIRSAGDAVRSGVGFLGEDRRTMGIFPGTSVATNMMLPDLARSSVRMVDAKTERQKTKSLRDRLSIQCASLDQDIRQLSGGNQQKVLIARWLNCDADVLLLDEPTRGVDVATKFAIHHLFAELAAAGKSILMASSELDELMGVCDRILVMSNRRLVSSFTADNWSESGILAAAFSGYSERVEQSA